MTMTNLLTNLKDFFLENMTKKTIVYYNFLMSNVFIF